jgi:putative transposase
MQVLQDVCKRVDLAFDAFFRRVQENQKKPPHEREPVGYPRFKGRGHYDSITYPQSGFAMGDNSVRLSKIGSVKAVLHRPVPGKIKTCTVRRQGEKWYVCFAVQVETEPLPESTKTVGIDIGLLEFAALSTGELVANPRFFRKGEKALAKAQRKFDKLKHKHRTKARRKAKKVVARIHERIRNRRHDFLHQVARRLVNRFGLIAVENLFVENMMAAPKAKPDADNPGAFLPNGASQMAGLNKSIADASWSMFRAILTQKAESAARVVIAVNPAYTSQDCSECGYRVKKTLSERIHVCPCCGLVLDRDVNAARNILKIAVGQHSVAA